MLRYGMDADFEASIVQIVHQGVVGVFVGYEEGGANRTSVRI